MLGKRVRADCAREAGAGWSFNCAAAGRGMSAQRVPYWTVSMSSGIPRGLRLGVPFIGIDDPLYERVAHDIA